MDRTRGYKRLIWRTALNCEGGACVRVAATENSVFIGSTKHPSGPAIEYTPDEWHAFVTGIKNGDFDDLHK